MPVGGGGKPAGGYRAGKKGSYGCKGYPTVSADGTVHGCHPTKAQAAEQARAIWASVNAKKSNDDMPPLEYFMEDEAEMDKADPCWDGYTQRGMKPGDNGRMVPNCVPVSKAAAKITEGDFVVALTTEGPVVGQVEHVMVEGGTYGQPGNPYAVESTPENPAVAIRMLEEEDGVYYYTPYSIGALMSDVNRINMPNISLEDYEDNNHMDKAEGYSPPAGARSAARRAIKFKEDGKATGAGTAVGWTRARQLANGETLSLSTVKRMYSYFSRHEVDKKGKDWGNQANPSNGYIMWLAWGGDSGYSWSRRIVESAKNKALFADFGKDWTTSRGLPDLFR